MSEQVTFLITVSTDDGRTKRLSTSYPPVSGDTALTQTGNTFLQTYNNFSTPNYDLSESLLRWDTSTLPDGIFITAATLRMWYTGGGAACTVYADWTAGGAIVAGDWINIASSPHDANAGSDADTYTPNSFVDLPLLNPNARINKAGYTGLRLICIPDTQPPTGDNTIFFVGYAHASLPEPRLIITYDPETGNTPPIGFSGRGAGW